MLRKPIIAVVTISLGSLVAAGGCQSILPGEEQQATLFPAPPVAGAIVPAAAAEEIAAPAPQAGVDPFQAMPPMDAHPLHVNVTNREWAWEQIVDIVDDYFRIEREQQVHLVGNVLTEGRIDTFPQIGGTIFEPQLMDSVGRYNRLESTLQTIRRRALVRVIPDSSGYLIDVEVYKELEDLPQPEHATAGAATFRNDAALPSHADRYVSRTELSDHWIQLGRDRDLEEEMKARLQACMGGELRAGGM